MPPLNSMQRNAIGLAVAHSLLASSTNAATITVNSSSDDTVGCTLREAIQVSNTNNIASTGCQISNSLLNDSDEIVFNLSGNNTITLSGSELEIAETVSITGPGADQLTIDADEQSRVFSINGGADYSTSNTSISGLTLTGGNSLSNGGAISILFSPDVKISDSVITNSEANNGNGSGIFVYQSGGLSITNTTVSNNSSIDTSITTGTGSSNNGGGIFIYYSNSVSISATTVSENTSTLWGGGIYAYNSPDLSINNSTVSNNTSIAGSGGGIYVGYSGDLSINSSTISGNEALNMNRVTGRDYGGSGGGIFTFLTAGSIVNSTISGNLTNRIGGGIAVATYVNDIVSLFGSTIVNNTSNYSGGGGGIGTAGIISTGAEISFNNVVANNIGGDCNSPLSSIAFNWIGDNSCLRTSILSLSGDPQLGALQDNGGPTLTHAPLLGSGLNNASRNCNGVDQRGKPRERGTCAIGSVEGEREAIVLPFNNGSSDFLVIPL